MANGGLNTFCVAGQFEEVQHTLYVCLIGEIPTKMYHCKKLTILQNGEGMCKIVL
jgi:hypothetical protein